MKIPAVLVLFLVLAASFSDAQLLESPGALAVGPAFEISFPAKSLADKAGTGFGGSARFEYIAYKNIGIVATAGYVAWADEGVPNITSKAHAFEFLVGPKFGLGGGVFGGIELGIYMAKEEFSVSGVQTLKTEQTKAMAGILAGYEFSGIDVGVKYYPFDSAYTNVMVSVGYWFGL